MGRIENEGGEKRRRLRWLSAIALVFQTDKPLNGTIAVRKTGSFSDRIWATP
jgi:hypothetical protein